MKICLFVAGYLIGLIGIAYCVYCTYKPFPYNNENMPVVIMWAVSLLCGYLGYWLILYKYKRVK